MTIREFLDEVERLLEEKYQLLFGWVRKNFVATASSIEDNPPDWQEIELGPNIAAGLYYSFLSQLQWQASQVADDTDDQAYEQATHIASVMRKLLKDETGAELEEYRIMSPSRLMESTGLVEIVEGPEGEKLVKPTELCDKIVQKLKRQIDRANAHRNN